MFVNNKPMTKYCLTDVGKEAFQKYIERLEKMLKGEIEL